MYSTVRLLLIAALALSCQLCRAQFPEVETMEWYPGKLDPTGKPINGLHAYQAPGGPLPFKQFFFSNYTDKPIIMCLGDSITSFGFYIADQDILYKFPADYRGWAIRLNDTLDGKAHILNGYSVGGLSTKQLAEWGMPRLFPLMAPHAKNVALVTLALGANDAVLPPSGWYQPIPDYISVLRQAITGLRAMGINNIMMMTPPPVGRRGDRSNNFTAGYAKAAVELAAEMHVPIANIYESLMQDPDWIRNNILTDGLHLTGPGNKVVYDTVWPVIHKAFPKITARGLMNWNKN